MEAAEGENFEDRQENELPLSASHLNRHVVSFVLISPLIALFVVLLYYEAHYAAYILYSILAIVALLFYLAYKTIEESRKAENRMGDLKLAEIDSLENAVSELSLTSNAKDTVKLLSAIRKRIHRNAEFCKDAANAGIVKSILLGLRDLKPDDKRISVSLDILNEIFAVPGAKSVLMEEDKHGLICMHDIIDSLIIVAKDILKAVRPEEKVVELDFMSKSSDLDRCQNDEAAENEEESHLLGSIRKLESEEKLKNDIYLPAFVKYGYKLVLSLGLLAADHQSVQTRMGDRGGLQIVLDIVRCFPENQTISKWGCWSCIHLTFLHPPNKREFVDSGGLAVVIKALNANLEKTDVIQQGLALLFNILSDDPHAKMKMSKVRQTALASGLVEIIQSAQFKYKHIADIQSLSAQILEFLIKDFS